MHKFQSAGHTYGQKMQNCGLVIFLQIDGIQVGFFFKMMLRSDLGHKNFQIVFFWLPFFIQTNIPEEQGSARLISQ